MSLLILLPDVKAQNINIRAFWNASSASVMCNRMSIKFSIYLLFGLLQNNARVSQGSNSNNELKKNPDFTMTSVSSEASDVLISQRQTR